MLPYLNCFHTDADTDAVCGSSSITSVVCDVSIRSSSFIFTRMQHSLACFIFDISVIIVAFSDHVVCFCLFSLLLLPLNCRFSVFAANFLSKFSCNNRPTFVLPRDRGIGDTRTEQNARDRGREIAKLFMRLIILR